MLEHYEEIQRLGGEVLAVSFTGPERLRSHLQIHPLPCPVAGDATFKAYHQFELGRTTWLAMLRPVVIFRFVRKILHGWLPEKHPPGEDLLQLGGDFVIDRQGRLAFVYRSAHPMDRPSAGAILEAVRSAS